MTRSEHVQWSKDRALEYVKQGDTVGAFASISSDLSKSEETENHPAMHLGMALQIRGHLSTPKEMEKFIEGIN